MSFLNDLKHGQEAEKTLADFLISKNFTVTSTLLKGKFDAYDLEVSQPDLGIHYTCEVKRDTGAIYTGNIAVEVGKIINGVPHNSGLSATKADYFVYKMDGIPGYYAMEVEKLKKLVQTDAKHKCQGGDFGASTIVLIDRKVYIRNSYELISYYSK